LSENVSPKSQDAYRRKSVLFVDDDRAVCDIVVYRLARQGLRAGSCPDRAKAFERAKLEKPDLIVLDYLMPDASGLELCRALKMEPLTCGIPVVVFTTHEAVGFEQACVAAGAVGVIYKPYVAELVRLIKRILSGESIDWMNYE